MRQHVILLPALALTFAAALGLGPACSSASTEPLGGPYGGNATVTPPAGSSSSEEGGASGSGGGSSGGGGSSSGAAAGSSSGAAAGSSSGSSGPALTWSELWTKYMAAGTVGSCAQSACHGDPTKGCASASECFTWLKVSNGYDYITGGINNNGLFIWTPNGFMPATGPASNPQAVSDYAAWTAAGSQNN